MRREPSLHLRKSIRDGVCLVYQGIVQIKDDCLSYIRCQMQNRENHPFFVDRLLGDFDRLRNGTNLHHVMHLNGLGSVQGDAKQ
jgi:hypothetical protein